MKKSIIHLFILVLSLETVLLIGCAPSLDKIKAKEFVGGHVNDAIKYYGEPYEEWTKDKSSVVMKKPFPFVVNKGKAGRLHGAPSGSRIYWFKQYHPEDPKFLYCIVVYLVDKEGNILKLQECRCRERPFYLR